MNYFFLEPLVTIYFHYVKKSSTNISSNVAFMKEDFKNKANKNDKSA